MGENEILVRLVSVEERAKTNSKRIDDAEKEIKENRDLTVAVKEIATEMKYLREEQLNMNKRLKTIEEKPSKNWDNLKWIIISNVVIAILSGIIGKFCI